MREIGFETWKKQLDPDRAFHEKADSHQHKPLPAWTFPLLENAAAGFGSLRADGLATLWVLSAPRRRLRH